eukprot:352281-Chlamydomonas_euryale.AAC.3
MCDGSVAVTSTKRVLPGAAARTGSNCCRKAAWSPMSTSASSSTTADAAVSLAVPDARCEMKRPGVATSTSRPPSSCLHWVRHDRPRSLLSASPPVITDERTRRPAALSALTTR